MTNPTITIRVNYRDWRKLQKIFPGEKGESVAHYLQRYIQSLKEQDETK